MKKTISVLLCLILVLSTFAGMFCIPASAADTPATHKVFDFENVTAEQFTAIAKSGYASEQSIETNNAISGSGSWKIAFPNAGSAYNDGAALSLGNFDKTKAYRVSGKYRILSGTLGTTRIVNSATNTDFGHIFSTGVPAGRHFFINDGALTASTTVRTFSNTVEPTSNNGFIALAVKPAGSKTVEVIFDDITVAEIIDAPTAVTSDATKGTAKVVNKSGKSDYAAGETAVFTATPNAGYAFSHWTDASGATVSNLATYEHTLTGATTLTAHFALAGVKTFDFENNDADGAVAITNSEYASTQGIEKTNVIAGNGSWKISFPNSSGTTYTNGAALKLGNFNKSKTYRVSGKYRVLSGTLGTTRVINAASDTNFGHIFTTSNIGSRLYTINDMRRNASATVYTFSGIVKPTYADGSGRILLATRPADNSTVEVIFDDITVAEIVTAPTVSANSDMGTATVINKAGYSDYAVGETAVFTATPNRGYRFIGWENASGTTVSSDATYEVAMNGGGDFALTANFEKVIQTALNNAVAIRTAEASQQDGGIGKQGMRVYNSINKKYSDSDIVEYGSIAIREEYLGKVQNALETEEGFTLALYDMFDAKYPGASGFGKGVSYNKEDDVRRSWEITESDYIFTAFLTGIAPKNYGDKYLIRSYAKDENGNMVYGEIVSYSIYDVVYTILEVEKETSGLGYEAAMAIKNNAIAADEQDSGVVTYEEWLNPQAQ